MDFYFKKEKESEFLRAIDLFREGKYLIEIVGFSFETESIVNEAYINKILNSEDSGLAAIEFAGVLYIADGVTGLSDGMNEIFVPRRKS